MSRTISFSQAMIQAHDDKELGPMFPDSDKYNMSQLKNFSLNLASKCYWFTEMQRSLSISDPKEYISCKRVLFDSNLSHLRVLIVKSPSSSKNLYLRLLQRFIDCLKENDSVFDYSSWFDPPVPKETRPAEPRVQTPSLVRYDYRKTFNPNDPASYQYFLENPF